jgi:gamma-glutamyltranspeptidase / glutathione hydrolase
VDSVAIQQDSCAGKRHSGLSPKFLFTALLLLVLCAGCSQHEAIPVYNPAAVASAHPLATQAGMDILAAGGNAFDAAVAVSAALAVVEPYSSGLGGGGFWLLHRASDGFEVMVDGREKAPLAARRDMYLDTNGDVVPDLSIDGALAAAIPGAPAALVHIARQYGRLPLARSLAPAIRLAREGFTVEAHYQKLARFRLATLQADSAAAAIFLAQDDVPATGYRVVQPELADTLEAIAQQGRDGFYAGRVAQQLVAGIHAAGGIWTQADLDQYQVIERVPVRAEYHGLRITSVPPPSSGGVALSEMLNLLSGFDLSAQNRAERAHLVIEAMRRAYRDRAEFLGDSDFDKVPVERLLSRAHADQLAVSIDLKHATPSASLPGRELPVGSDDTTHFSILDAAGNRVAATLSINYPFGSGVVAPGTGVLLNDEMDDFSAKPGVPNVYGLVGSGANAIEPGKRPLSSMSPTFVESDNGVAILGTPGGSRIITMVLLAILDISDGGLPQSWVSLPRYHHQYLPDVVQYEEHAFDAKTLQALRAMGHKLQAFQSTWGNMQAIWFDRKTRQVYAASDPRGIGAAQVQ